MKTRLLIFYITILSLAGCSLNDSGTKVQESNSLLPDYLNVRNYTPEVLRVIENGASNLFTYYDVGFYYDSALIRSNLSYFESDLRDLIIDRSDVFLPMFSGSSDGITIDSIRTNLSKYPEVKAEAFVSFKDSLKIVTFFPKGMIIHIKLDTIPRTSNYPHRFEIIEFIMSHR